MNIEEIRLYCLRKAKVEESMPFGPDTLVFKVCGKIFLLLGLEQYDELCFNVKCEPAYALELRETYPHTVFPAYHMNKKHWNTLVAHQELSDQVLYELIDHSYQCVIAGLPKRLKEELS